MRSMLLIFLGFRFEQEFTLFFIVLPFKLTYVFSNVSNAKHSIAHVLMWCAHTALDFTSHLWLVYFSLYLCFALCWIIGMRNGLERRKRYNKIIFQRNMEKIFYYKTAPLLCRTYLMLIHIFLVFECCNTIFAKNSGR